MCRDTTDVEPEM